MRVVHWPAKTSSEALDFSIDVSDGIPAGDAIATVAWSVPSPLVRVSDALAGNVVTVLLGGGTTGTTYHVTATITTTQGRVLECLAVLSIVSPAAGAASYGGNPSGSSIDRVRFLLGDTNVSAPAVTDGEITQAVADQGGDAYAAAAGLADMLGARALTEVDVSVDGVSVQTRQRATGWFAIASRIRQEAVRMRGGNGTGGGAVVVTGLRRSDMRVAEADGERITPAFTIEEPVDPTTQQIGWVSE